MRTKKAFYNLITGIIPQILIGILGFIKIKIFINVLGVEINGLMQLFAQIFAYLSLAEGGIGAGIQFRLYKLLSNKKYQKINRLLKGSKIYFRKVAYIIIGLAMIICFKLDIFIKNNPFELSYIQIAFVLYLISSLISYFFVSDRILLSSDQKLYKINIIFNSSQVLKFIIEILLLIIGTNIFVILFVYILLNITSFVILKKVVAKEYSWYDTKAIGADYDFKKDMKHLFPHKLINTVAKSTDVIVISSFLGIAKTSIYGVYNYIMSLITQIIDQISSSLFSIIGNYNATEPVQKTKRVFDQYCFFTMFLANIICIPLLLTFNKFILLWVGPLMVVDKMTMSLFVFILYYNISMIPVGTLISVNGLFKQTKICIIIETIMNISLSLLLVSTLGIKGVLIGTLFSLLISSFIYYPFILYKNVFKEKQWSFYIRVIKNFIIFIISFFIVSYIIHILNINTNTIFLWVLFGIFIFIINGIIVLILSKLFFQKEAKEVFKRIKAGVKI